MALIDDKLVLCDATSVGVAEAYIGDVIDLGANGKDGWGNALIQSPGEGQSAYFNVLITTVLASVAQSLIVSLAYDETLSGSDLALGASDADIAASIVFMGNAAAGTSRSITVPMGGMGRYIETHVNADASRTGAIDAWISNVPFDSIVGTYKQPNA